MLNPFPVVLADIRRSRSGVLAVVALIAVAVALGVAVSAQERALRRGSAQAADAFDLMIGAPGGPTQLVLSGVYLQAAALPLVRGAVLQRLQGEAGVAFAAPLAFGDRHRGHPVVGTTAPFATRGGTLTPSEGRIFGRADEAIIGADVPMGMGERFQPAHGAPRGHEEAATEEQDHHEFAYTIVGRLPRLGTPWDRAILVPVEAVWRLHGLPTGHAEGAERIGPPWEGPAIGGVPAIVVKPRSVADAYRLRGKYRTDDSMAVFPAEVLVELYALLGDARDLLALFAVATQTLVVAAVLLAVFATLEQRRRLLALLRALGASRGFVFAAVWVQVSLMVAIGSACGLLGGWAGALVISTAFAAKTGIALPVVLTVKEVGMTLAFGGLGMLLAVIPARFSYRYSVAAGLRA
jgi:putative ABC transport system permease protein